MIISNRLRFISNLIDKVDSIIDVGTDHGYVPIDLLKKGTVKKVIASDINKGPVERARENILLSGLSDRADCRLGGGFKTIRPGEVEAGIIAGMGGNLIRDIIEEDMEVFKSLKYVIAQPVQNPEVLRKYVLEKGFNLEDEWIIFDEGKYYEIMKISYNSKSNIINPVYYDFSEILINKKDKVYKEFLKDRKSRYIKIVDSLNSDSDNSIKRKAEIEEKIAAIDGFILDMNK